MRRPRIVCQALSCCLIFGVAATAGPAQAQAPTRLHDAIARESARFGADTTPPGTPTDGWWRVREIAPATEVVVVTRTSGETGRFLQAKDSSLTLLHSELPGIPAPARDWLLDMAANHPQVLAMVDAQPATTVTGRDGTIRLSRDGLYVGNQKVAEFVELLESIDRATVIEVSKPVLRGGDVDKSVLAGMAAFFPCGFAASPLLCEGSGCGGSVILFRVLMFGCPVAVAAGVYQATRSRMDIDVIYRAPRERN